MNSIDRSLRDGEDALPGQDEGGPNVDPASASAARREPISRSAIEQELLDALRAVLSDWDAHGGAALTKARTALAKAELPRPQVAPRCPPGECIAQPTLGNVFMIYRCTVCGDEEWL